MCPVAGGANRAQAQAQAQEERGHVHACQEAEACTQKEGPQTQVMVQACLPFAQQQHLQHSPP